ncbi:MAG: hypothetical protein F4069_03265 [Rhodothermaceae bacterium]|nr:hypothetical protein [Bacteroidota bacterium]MXW32833.1 hypothetical protein [Rhodothermaceae bacterium]MXZ17814.1 hypothetical protein [Rhodothermaceae bacterium]MYE63514.1 hypothetical protein [Rhodothermaceae bacterium]MYG68654.1 hypothetical protein [Rhodothermaceae bacterium]
MALNIPFFIDEKLYEVKESPQKLSTLLQYAGESPEDTVLISEDGVEYTDPDTPVEVVKGSRFKTRKRNNSSKPVEKQLRYTVNGEQNTTVENPLPLGYILKNAGAGAAIDVNDLDSYYLENTVDGRKYENLDSLVTIVDGDNFLAIHVGSTPVAQYRCYKGL